MKHYEAFVVMGELPEKLSNEILDGLIECWPHLADLFREKGRILNESHPDFTVTLHDGEDLVAHCGLVDRLLRTDRYFSVIGLQQLFVMPAYRESDVTQQVLQACTVVGRRLYKDFAAGFARDGICEFHRKAGWAVSERLFEEHHLVYTGIDCRTEELDVSELMLEGGLW